MNSQKKGFVSTEDKLRKAMLTDNHLAEKPQKKERKKRVLNPKLRNKNKGMTLPIFLIEALQEEADKRLLSVSKLVEMILIEELNIEIPENKEK